MPTKRINAVFNPSNYHGWGKKKRFFEGWYFKIVSRNQEHALAIIPGIAMDKAGNQQAFIQVLDGKKFTADYHTFSADAFIPAPKKFDLLIGTNRFNASMISVDLPELKGELEFEGHVNWPSSWYSPNIMGPFSFFPFMECYHGIVSMNHTIQGSLEIGGSAVNFSGGKGYLEKDWGHSFPSAYIWMQSNHFSHPGISLKASVARIPWMGAKFTGFIAGIWIDDKVIQFTTYNFTQLKKAIPGTDVVEIILENKRYRLEIDAHRGSSTALIAPIGGLMDGRVEESMTAEIHVKLIDKKSGEVVLDDIGKTGAIEVAGKVSEITIDS